jgi:hypothetical protein
MSLLDESFLSITCSTFRSVFTYSFGIQCKDDILIDLFICKKFKLLIFSKNFYFLFSKVLVLIVRGDQISDSSIKSMINPDIEIKNCTFGEICTGGINSSSVHFYSVEYSFDPTMVRKRRLVY